MADVSPLDQDDYLLQQLGNRAASGATRQDLADTGTEVMNKLEWTLQQYGQALERLVENGWIKAAMQRASGGRYTLTIPTEVTGRGWHRIKQLQRGEDPRRDTSCGP